MSDETIRVVGRSGRVLTLPASIARGMLRNPDVRLADEDVTPERPDEYPSESADLGLMKVKDLRDLAKARGIALRDARTKAEILALITSSSGE